MDEQFNPAEKLLLNKLGSFCAYRERCISEVRLKMEGLGIARQHQEKYLRYLLDENFINEERYAEIFVRSKVNHNRWGRMKIQAALKQKGLPEKLIVKAMQNIDLMQYSHNLENELKKKAASLKSGAADRQKLLSFALSKGYTYAEITETLKHWN